MNSIQMMINSTKTYVTQTKKIDIKRIHCNPMVLLVHISIELQDRSNNALAVQPYIHYRNMYLPHTIVFTPR